MRTIPPDCAAARQVYVPPLETTLLRVYPISGTVLPVGNGTACGQPYETSSSHLPGYAAARAALGWYW